MTAAGSLSVAVVTSGADELRQHDEAFLAGLRAGLAGPGGPAVEVSVLPSSGTVGETVAEVERFLDLGGQAVAVCAPSSVAAEIASVAERRRVLAIIGTALGVGLRGPRRFVFSSAHDLDDELAVVAASLQACPGARVRVLARPTLLGYNAVASARTVLEPLGHQVDTTLVRGDAAALGEIVEGIAADGPDAVVVAWDDADREKLAAALTAAGLAARSIVVNGTGQLSPRPGPDALERILCTVGDAAPGAPTVLDGLDRALVRYGTGLRGAATAGVRAALLLARAAGAADADGRVRALEGRTIDGPGGTATVCPRTHRLRQGLRLRGPAEDAGTLGEWSGEELNRLRPVTPWAVGMIQHVAVRVGDVERALRFYVEGLGGRLSIPPMTFPPPVGPTMFGAPEGTAFRYCMVTFGATSLELFSFEGHEPAPARPDPDCFFPHVGIEVPHTPSALERVERYGGTRIWPVMGRFGRVATWFFADPDGNVVELMDGTVDEVAMGGVELAAPDDPVLSF
ncbi:ABC transporter substrate-binding protein [Pseudonocardia sp. RS010]|uniref:ABC transporter substrate-binding protein n=1 Tax=Pseudonocardia sp. RS010 TaxID=3385979 RepID=UPI0039A173A1